jgi:hypothetical protein
MQAAMTFKLKSIGLFAAVVATVLMGSGRGLAADYKLGPQDKLRIKVYEWPALSDEVTVSADGIISLPLIGNVNAAGMSATGLAREIADQLQSREKLAGKPYAAVEVLQYRSFYVLGDVQRPGDYPYRPGMTVLMALSISGGMYRGAEDLGLLRDAIVGQGTLATLNAKKSELVVRLARLKGELGGKNMLELDATTNGSSRRPSESLVQQENAILAAQGIAFNNRVAKLRLQIELYREEVRLLEARMASSIKQQKSAEREAQALKQLGDRGLGILPREAATERLAAQIEGDQREIDTLVVKARQNIEQTEAEIMKLADDREKELRTAIHDASRQLEDVELQIVTQSNLIAEVQLRSGTLLLASQGAANLRFRITRRDIDGRSQEFTAKADDIVEPGDVITVTRDIALGEPGAKLSSRMSPGEAAKRTEITRRSTQ